MHSGYIIIKLIITLCKFYLEPKNYAELYGYVNFNQMSSHNIEINVDIMFHSDYPLNLNSLLHMLQGQMTSKWYLFGLALGVPKMILDQLTDYSEEDSLVEVLDYWLTHHPQKPTWQEITDAQKKLSFKNL